MAFTYNLSSTGDDLIVSKIRLEIGDTVEDSGVKPDGTNYQDNEILYFYSEADSSINEATALIFDNLAGLWAGAGESVRIRDYTIDTKGKAESYRAMAAEIRGRSGLVAGVIQHDFQQTDTTSDLP